MSTVLTFGTFDHLHPGHIAYLTEASTYGDLHIVVARDAHVESIKGLVPDHTEQERLEALQTAFPDATVLLGDEVDYLAPVKALKPDCIVLGYDQRLPPGIAESDLPCTVKRASPFDPERYKSSIMREKTSKIDKSGV